jgi:ABC-type uncharacterized transport system ATPase subunit
VRLLVAHGLTVLLVEHDMRFVMDISDRVVVVEAGKYLTAGTPDEVRRDPAVIRAYLGGGGEQGVVASDALEPDAPLSAEGSIR